MNAYLVDKPSVRLELNATAHEIRKRALEKCPELREAPKRYRVLKELSEDVRYDPEFELKDEHRDDSKRLLAKIVAIVDPKIKKS